MYKLTKQHFSYGAGGEHVPVLICGSDTGPFDRNCRLPFTHDSLASAFVWRHLLGETLPTDPALACDDGADLATYCWEYLTWRTPAETIRFAEMYHKLKKRGIKIPLPQLA